MLPTETRRTLESGVENLDLVLGGGIPEGDLLLVVGAPGSGKTTLVFQVAFHAATRGKTVIYLSTLSEPAARLLKHIRTFSFYDERLVGKRVFLEGIYPIVKQGVGPLTDALVETVRAHAADLVILDGFTTIRDLHPEAIELRTFVNDLAVAVAPLGCTLLLTSSSSPDMRGATQPELTMCDGIVELSQQETGTGGSPLRMIRAWKVRGAPCLLGNHSLKITGDGLVVYPRIESRAIPAATLFEPARLSMGTPELDTMMSGGLPRGSMTIVAGAPGTGKTLLGLQYLVAGARRGEKGLLVGFRESTRQLLAKARAFDLDLASPLAQGLVTLFRRVPVELDLDEVLSEMWARVEGVGVERLVIDSGIELEQGALDVRRRRGIMAALADGLRARGITTVVAHEMGQAAGPELDFSSSPLGVFGENVLLLRYVELEDQLARIVSILKMRETAHDHSIRQYEIDRTGFHVLAPLASAEGLLGKIARLAFKRRRGESALRFDEGGEA